MLLMRKWPNYHVLETQPKWRIKMQMHTIFFLRLESLSGGFTLVLNICDLIQLLHNKSIGYFLNKCDFNWLYRVNCYGIKQNDYWLI